MAVAPQERWELDPRTGQYVQVPPGGIIPTDNSGAGGAGMQLGEEFHQQQGGGGGVGASTGEDWWQQFDQPASTGGLGMTPLPAMADAASVGAPAELLGSMTTPWGGWNASNIFDYEAINERAKTGEFGISRDEIANQRDAYIKNAEQQYHDAFRAQGRKAEGGTANLFADPTFQNFIRTGQIPPDVIQNARPLQGDEGGSAGGSGGGGASYYGDVDPTGYDKIAPITPYGKEFTDPTLGENIAPITPYGKEFAAPSAEEARQTPGYQFTLNEALRALDLRKAGQGRLRAGVGRDYGNLVTGLADSTYENTFNRALGTFNTNLGAHYTGENARFGSQMGLGESRFNRALGTFGTNRDTHYAGENARFGSQMGLAGSRFANQLGLANARFGEGEANRQFGLARDQFGAQQGQWQDQFRNLQDQQYYDRLFQLQSLGDPTRETATRFGYTNPMADYRTQGANAQAAGQAAGANAWSNWAAQNAGLAQSALLNNYYGGGGGGANWGGYQPPIANGGEYMWNAG